MAGPGNGGPKPICQPLGQVNEFGNQLMGPMSITKLSPNWGCQLGPNYCPKFLLSGLKL